MSWEVDLAREIKMRDNRPRFGAVAGKVISESPFLISIYDDRVLIHNQNGRVCRGVLLEKGREVVCLPTEDGQNFFIVGML